ncbi:hypothetical protein LVJ94_03085 [Pendulispora rubella]|uniref:Uncharacterized protein n=1 Tax=Pendulispora rubella TaxID=2741070 RepID=A0ABZ2L628_9BACT
MRNPREPWKTIRPTDAAVKPPYQSTSIAQYRGELYYTKRRGDHITLTKTPHESYASNEGFQRDKVGGPWEKTVPMVELDAWYCDDMHFRWRGGEFVVLGFGDGKVHGGWIGSESSWCDRNGVKGSHYDGYYHSVDVAEVELYIVHEDLRVHWMAEVGKRKGFEAYFDMPQVPWKTVRPVDAAKMPSHPGEQMAQYRGETYFKNTRQFTMSDRVYIMKMPDTVYSSNEGFELSTLCGLWQIAVPVDDLDAWYRDVMYFRWRDTDFGVESFQNGKVHGCWFGHDASWCEQNGVKGDWYNGYFHWVDVAEVELYIVHEDFLARRKAERKE